MSATDRNARANRPGHRSLLAWIGWAVVLFVAIRFVAPLTARVLGLGRSLLMLLGRGSRVGPALIIAAVFLLAVGARYALQSRRNRR